MVVCSNTCLCTGSRNLRDQFQIMTECIDDCLFDVFFIIGTDSVLASCCCAGCLLIDNPLAPGMAELLDNRRINNRRKQL